MPFTLAHPALVMPLRRWRMFHILPLLIGSMAPDLASYVPWRMLGRVHRIIWRIGFTNTHTLKASVTIDLVAGLLLLWLVVWFGRALTAPLWQPHRSLIRRTLTDFRQRAYCWWLAIPSLLIGIWGHIAWDLFTHENTLIVDRFAWLQQPMFPGAAHELPIYQSLQYGSSIAGLAIVAWWYLRGLKEIRVSQDEVVREAWRKWMLLALCLPCALIGGTLWLFLLQRAPSLYAITSDAVRVVVGMLTASYVILATLLHWLHTRADDAE